MIILPQSSGIYRITCIANNRIYIGSAKNFHRRWMSHWQALKRGDHKNRHLQNAWSKHGEQSFIFEVIELCEFDVLLIREQYYIDTLKPFSPVGFNISKGAHAGMVGIKHTPESKEKNRQAHIGKTASEETRAKLSEALKGRKQSSEWNEKRHAPLRGRIQSAESRAKTSETTKAAMTLEIREFLAAKRAKQWVVTTPEGVEMTITNLEKFCKENGIHPSGMRSVAYGLYSQHKGWLCRHA